MTRRVGKMLNVDPSRDFSRNPASIRESGRANRHELAIAWAESFVTVG
jgi:hypothetical protein